MRAGGRGTRLADARARRGCRGRQRRDAPRQLDVALHQLLVALAHEVVDLLAVLLAATGLSHVLPTFFALTGAGIEIAAVRCAQEVALP